MTEPRAQSWWHTVPGMLTGAAAVITAITGLFLAFNQAGWLRRATDAGAADTMQSAAEAQSAAKASAPSAGAPVLEPTATQVTVGNAELTLLDVQTRPRNAETYALTINVRFHNLIRYPVNFWNSNFRLLTDGVPRAPVGDLNQVVDGNSALEGDVEFIVPVTATTLALRILVGQESTEIGLRR
jgi:hypothetical protein